MSVLSFPRLYFQGYMEWDVCTSNNNDYLPVYDAANAALDWQFLGLLDPPITPDNFRDTFRPWAIEPYDDSCPISTEGPSDACGSNPASHLPSRWNFYGSQGCSFIQHAGNGALSLASGGDLAYGSPAAPTDPILNQPVSIVGNSIGGRISAARLIDINPASPFCSQIYLSSFSVGNPETRIGGAVSQRMYSRSFFVPRNISSDLIIAGPIGAIFQTTIPTASLDVANGGNSALVTALADAARATGAAGLMLRFATYNTVYYQNGIFNDIAERPRTCADLTALYKQGKVFINPAYSRVVGVLGVWNQGELKTAPGGHMLVPNMKMAPMTRTATASVRATEPSGMSGHAVQFAAGADMAGAKSALPPLAPGVVHAEIDAAAGIVSLDLQNAIPEYTLDADLQAERYNYGPIDVGVQIPGGAFQLIGTFGAEQYDKGAYSAKGGLVDVPFQAGVTAEQIETWLGSQNGQLALRAQGQILSLEAPLTVETDDRGVYIDQGQSQNVQLQVRYKNAIPPPGTGVLAQQYFPWLLDLGTGSWSLFGATPPPTSQDPGPVCNALPASPYLVYTSSVPVDPQGNATVTINSQAPGFPILAYYPALSGQGIVPPASVGFSFAGPGIATIGTSFYSVARVLPFDDALVGQFIDCWNGTGGYAGKPKYNRLEAWRFVYGNILYVYDMIFPVMDLFMPLGDLPRVEGAIDQLMVMITTDMEVASTLYMPVTRDLSAGKRNILEMWGGLVVRKYPQVPLP
ncbi:MAG TPA: hypothetical protein VN851_20965 [Thermoanaerobaculia bacterium]|nr:hypothetical protein [Thermoanaerobaculia bacterium]